MQIRLGQNIRKLRKEAGYTQEQLAEALGVTTGAVYKWESDRAVPELELLVEIAEFFETSVDALLNYGWEKRSMGQAAQRLHNYIENKQLEEGIRYAEQALQKYPNSFQITLESAELYFLYMDPKHAQRAVELYQKAIQLIDQNTDETVGLLTIQNRIAGCYCYMGRMEDAVELLKKNNVGGVNDPQIGLVLSQDEKRAEEALKYLSDALYMGYSQLYSVCIGYANAYGVLEEPDKIGEMILWLLELGKGLRDTTAVTWMDRTDVRLYTILAEAALLRGEEEGAISWLQKARDTARRFDAAPEHRTSVGMKYYHGSKRAASYDDMGQTALSMIENFMAEGESSANLRPLWEKIREKET